MRKIILLLFIVIANHAFSQSDIKPFIRFQQPAREKNDVKYARQYIVGATCKGCTLIINNEDVKVYSTGAFAYPVDLIPGDTVFNITAASSGKKITKKISYSYSIPKPADTIKTLAIGSIETFPEGNLYLQNGDKIEFKIKALTGCIVKAGSTTLNEMPVTQTGGMPGIYQGEYTIKQADSFQNFRFPIIITDKDNNKASGYTKDTFTVILPGTSNIFRTKGRLAYIEFGLGNDRLGGSKIGYLDSNILLNVTGKIGNKYRVKLANTRTAYIPDEGFIEMMPKGTFAPQSLTTNWQVYGDDKFDYVKVGLSERLPYQAFQSVDPSKIVVDIFGAANNTNWIKQFESAKEIKNVDYEQVADDIFRVTIELKHQQIWGYQIYYNNNELVIKVKHQPKDLSLKSLVIAIDAGHGGTNNGAIGPTGVYEKDITLPVALKLQSALQKEGATVIMTRIKEQYFDNKQRILFYRDSMPDLLLSIHLNSSEDPISVSGTSAYYRYVGFRPLSHFIYKRMLELGLKEYGNTGAFNFMLNSPTEYPNALIETLFLSNPAEEEKALDEKFQQQMADKIVLGVKDFLSSCK